VGWGEEERERERERVSERERERERGRRPQFRWSCFSVFFRIDVERQMQLFSLSLLDKPKRAHAFLPHEQAPAREHEVSLLTLYGGKLSGSQPTTSRSRRTARASGAADADISFFFSKKERELSSFFRRLFPTALLLFRSRPKPSRAEKFTSPTRAEPE
jgi:hypothetical protein